MIRTAVAVFVLAMAGFALAQGDCLCAGNVGDMRYIHQDTSPTGQFVSRLLRYLLRAIPHDAANR
jgi:hypothetical protein